MEGGNKICPDHPKPEVERSVAEVGETLARIIKRERPSDEEEHTPTESPKRIKKEDIAWRGTAYDGIDGYHGEPGYEWEPEPVDPVPYTLDNAFQGVPLEDRVKQCRAYAAYMRLVIKAQAK